MQAKLKARLKRIVCSRALWVTVVCLAAYVILGLTLPLQPFLELVRIFQATTALVAVVAFSADAWESLTSKDESDEPTNSLIIGVFLQHVAMFWTGVWLLLYRLAEHPEWMLNVLLFGFMSGWLSSIAAVLHVWAPGVLRSPCHDATVPPLRLRMAGLAAALGMFGVLVVLATRPNASRIVEALHPWIW